jgi:hypothetical protein
MTFRRFDLLVAALLLGALAVPAPAQADPPVAACTVTPNPVTVGTAFEVDAAGLAPNFAYFVHLHQAGTEARDVFATADASGNASTGPVVWGDVGTASAKWYKLTAFQSGGGPVISTGPAEQACDLTIVSG